MESGVILKHTVIIKGIFVTQDGSLWGGKQHTSGVCNIRRDIWTAQLSAPYGRQRSIRSYKPQLTQEILGIQSHAAKPSVTLQFQTNGVKNSYSHGVWSSNRSGWWAATWITVLKLARLLCDSLLTTPVQAVLIWMCSFLMVVSLFNGVKVKTHHAGKLSMTCFVWIRGCNSAQGRKFLVKEHLSGITNFTNKVMLFSLHSVTGNQTEELKRTHPMLRGSFLSAGYQLPAMNQCCESGVIWIETITWPYPTTSREEKWHNFFFFYLCVHLWLFLAFCDPPSWISALSNTREVNQASALVLRWLHPNSISLKSINTLVFQAL